ncbi:MAG: polysaccharide deacetylase family protein [Actinomycetota bacterium]
MVGGVVARAVVGTLFTTVIAGGLVLATASPAAAQEGPTPPAAPAPGPAPESDPDPVRAAAPDPAAGAIGVVEPASAFDRPKPIVYLTFDDGPGVSTPGFLDVLAAHRAQATFFITGGATVASPDVARRIVADGHAVANHTWNHPQLTSLSSPAIADQLLRTTDVIRTTTGVTPTCFRPPFGATDGRVQSVAESVGVGNATWTTASGGHRGLWDVDTNDWRLSLASSSWTEARMRAELDRVGDGDVVLMHDGLQPRPRGLATFRRWMAVNGERFDFRALPGCGAPDRRLYPLDIRIQDQPRFQIARLYQAYFDRQPDTTGWAYWIEVYRLGRSLAEISHWFALSSEFAAAGPLDDRAFVEFVYANVLQRSSDPEGLRYWQGELERSVSRGRLVTFFSESPEFVAATAAVMTGGCYRGDVEAAYACWAHQLDD